MSWWITRPEPDASRLVAALTTRGVTARALPALERVPEPGALAGFDADLFLLSSRSVIAPLVAAVGVGRAAAAIGPQTAAAARDAGLDVVLEARGGAIALAQAVKGAWDRLGRPSRLGWPTSDAGVVTAEQAEARRLLGELRDQEGLVPRLDVRPCLSLRAVPGLAEAVAAAARADVAYRILFTSPSAVRSLAAIPLHPVEIRCAGASTWREAMRLRAAGWPEPQLIGAADLVEGLLLRHEVASR